MMDFKKQKRGVNAVLALSYLVCFAKFIPIGNQIGEEGTGLFAAAFVIYMIYTFIAQEVFSGIIARMINNRMKRDQYKNAGRVFDFALLAGAASGIVMCALIFVLSGFLANTVVGMKNTVFIFRYLAPAFAFGTVSAVFSAYLKGVGDYVTDALLKLGTELLTALLCIVMSGILYQHGEKVARLLHQDVFAAVYGARGCGIAVSLAAFLMMLLYILFYAQTKVNFKRRTLKDASAREEEYSVYVHVLYISSAVYYASALLLTLCFYIEERLLVSHINKWNTEHPDQLLNAVSLWGRYFGKGAVFVFFPVAVIYVIYHGMSVYIKRSLNQDDRKNIRDTMQIRLRKYMMVFLPITIFIAVFAKPLMSAVSNGSIEEVSGAVNVGAFAIFFFGLAFIYAQVCVAMEKKLYILVVHGVTFILHLIIMNIGVRVYTNMATAIGLAQLVSAVAAAVLYGILLTLQLGFKHNFLHLVKPLIAGGLSGLLGALIVMLLYGKSADILTLLIGGVVFFVLYMIIMGALHGFSKKELMKMPAGEFLRQMFYHK